MLEDSAVPFLGLATLGTMISSLILLMLAYRISPRSLAWERFFNVIGGALGLASYGFGIAAIIIFVCEWITFSFD